MLQINCCPVLLEASGFSNVCVKDPMAYIRPLGGSVLDAQLHEGFAEEFVQ